MAEWLKAAVLKTVSVERCSGVRIPLPPPTIHKRGMTTTLAQYRQAKQDISKLHGAAKKELIARFNDLANELLQTQRELREEFNVKLAIPSKPKGRPRKAVPKTIKQAEKAPTSSSQVAFIERKLAAQKRKLEDATKSGKPEKLLKDRVYELEDELRLAREN